MTRSLFTRTAAMLGILLPLFIAALAPAGPTAPTLHVEIDAHAAPELTDWARHVGEVCVKQYPMIVAHLGGPGFTPPDHVRIVVVRGKGVAWTAGNVMTFNAGYFSTHRGDVGAAVHELCHVVQHYSGPQPGWLVEGIADQIRWFVYEPKNRRPHVNPARAHYTDGYQTTAAFLDWAQRTTDPHLVTKLNTAMRAGAYNDALFKQYTGTPLPELWQRFLASLK